MLCLRLVLLVVLCKTVDSAGYIEIGRLPATVEVFEDASGGTFLYSFSFYKSPSVGAVTCDFTTAQPSFELVLGTGGSQYTVQLASSPSLSYTSVSTYALAISCSDSGGSTTSNTGTLTVNLIQNVAPVFTNPSGTVDVSAKTTKAGMNIYTISYTDTDTASPLPYQAIDSITPAEPTAAVTLFSFSNDMLKVDYDLIDYDDEAQYVVEIALGDERTTSTQTVTVNIFERNTPPEFVNNTNLDVSSILPEFTTGRRLVYDVDSFDQEGDAIQMTLTQTVGAADFELVPATGEIYLLGGVTLDYETTPQYVYQVEIEDYIDKQTTSTFTLTVDVSNINEQPTFAATPSAVTIDEASTGTIVGTPDQLCSDPDGVPPDVITYSILFSTESAYFSINPSTAEVRLAQDFDYDDVNLANEVNLTIRCSDTDGLSDDTTYSITIQDINDNSPICSPSATSFSLTYAQVVNNTIVNVDCSDIDSTINAELEYSMIGLTSGYSQTYFQVDTYGNVSISTEFLMDYNTSFYVTVLINDKGTNPGPLSATVTLTITYTERPTITNYSEIQECFLCTTSAITLVSAAGLVVFMLLIVFTVLIVLVCCYRRERSKIAKHLSKKKKATWRWCGCLRPGELKKKKIIIDDMKSEVVRYSERDQYLEVLNQWADETGDRQIAPSKESGESVKERKEMTRRFLETHRNPKVFMGTKIFQKAQEKLMKNGVVILKGNIGDGKTTTAIALMVALFDEDECLLITSPEQWQNIEPRTVSVILLDDIFGSGSLDDELLKKWETKFEQIYEQSVDTKERTGVRVIITVRQNIFEQCRVKLKQYKLFIKDNIVDCTSEELSIIEKRGILGKHLAAEEKTVSKSEIDKGAKVHNSKLGYPECCALFVSKESFLIIGSQFFERPIEILFETLDKMYDGDKYGYLALVILVFQKDGILFVRPLEEFKDGVFKTKVLDLAFLCRVPISDHLHKFTLQALEHQVSPYVKFYQDRKCYTFAHESLMEAVMASFGERHPQEVLEGCTLPFLMDFVGTDENFEERPDEIFMMRVKKENFLALAKAFEHYISKGEVKKISQHRAMKDVRFIRFLFEYLPQIKNFEKLILSEDNNVIETRKHVGFLHSAIDQEVPNVELVNAILKTGVHAKKPMKEKWCEAELESAVCMAVKRGSYAIYKGLIETGIEPPDRLMEEEQYLTSVDIMRDLLKRRYWSNEQKDMALVRASRGLKPESQEIVTLLLQDNVAVNSIRGGTTPLCEAVKSGKMKTVMLLLTSGASVNDRDATQQTPLHHACDWNNIEVVKILLKREADVNAKDSLGFTPFLVAAGWGRETIIDLLLTKKVDPLAMDDQENTVLHICAANGQANIMKTLMTKFPKEMESLLIFRNRHGWTPLDFALRCGHLNATKLLIQTVMKAKDLKTQSRTFVHTRFFVVKLEDFNIDEKFQYRFLDESQRKTCFQMPRCNWFIQAGNRDEYEEVRLFSSKYENKLRQCLAKS